jgi:hypothetical protein
MYPWEIYIQRVDEKGDVLWIIDGATVCSELSDKHELCMVPDGEGGAIIAWVDERGATSRDIYAQRVDSLGALAWPAEGVPVCTTINYQGGVSMIPHYEGGVIISWHDSRLGAPNPDIYVQRIDEFGGALWAENGEAICTASDDQQNPVLVSDNYGGAIIAWEDWRGQPEADVYAQRVDNTGAPLWDSDGVPACTTVGGQSNLAMVSLQAGGAIICWDDTRHGLSDSDIYAQRVDASGSPSWTTNGAPVSIAPNGQKYPKMTGDGTSGVIVTWMDERNGNWDIFAQRLNFFGSQVWATGGVAVCTAPNEQGWPDIASESEGGAIIAWEDKRADTLDVYAQRIDDTGTGLWTIHGVGICLADKNQQYVRLVSDYDDGAIITWTDSRLLDGLDIYAQRVRADGGIEPDSLPDPTYSYVDWGEAVCPTGNVFITPFIGGSYVSAVVKNEYDEPIVGADVTIGLLSACDVCRCEPFAATTDAVGQVDLVLNGGLDVSGSSDCCEVTTVVQCMGVGIPWANTGGMLEDTRVWLSPDLNGDCAVDSQDSLIIQGDFFTIACRTDYDCSGLVDELLDYTEIFLPYFGDNCSAVIGAADKGQAVSPASSLVQNHPNPFNPLTHIAFNINLSGHVVLRVYDIAGRPVRTLVEGRREPQRYEVTWDGRDDEGNVVASGVYFYQLQVPGYAETKKMVLLK